MTNVPTLGVTQGDPAGIGPEITVKALSETENKADRNVVVYGDPCVIQRAADIVAPDAEVKSISRAADADFSRHVINVVDTGTVRAAEDVEWGKVQELAGRAAVTAIERATAAALAGEIDGIVTAPINKEAIWKTGSEFLGHTEMLESLCHAQSTDTMFVVRGLKIFFATRHMSLQQAVASIDRDLIDAAITRAVTALRTFGSERARLAVAALNPHGGEGGHFGHEEIDVLRPAVEAAAANGLDVVGPVPADAVFHQGVGGVYDGVLSLYHDQGHIASKTLDFDGTVSVTAGLPILRTSVDHGTAFDIAGSGKASAKTMESALAVAADFAKFVPTIRRNYPPVTEGTATRL